MYLLSLLFFFLAGVYVFLVVSATLVLEAVRTRTRIRVSRVYEMSVLINRCPYRWCWCPQSRMRPCIGDILYTQGGACPQCPSRREEVWGRLLMYCIGTRFRDPSWLIFKPLA